MPIPKISLTAKIFIGLILGILIGWLLPDIGWQARPLSNLFLNLIKCIIAPLVFATLVIGISGTGDMKQVGRIGAKSLLYFEIVTTLALAIGLFAVNIAQPGKGLSLKDIEKTENKKDLSDRASALAKDAKEAASKAATSLENGNTSESIELSARAAGLSSEASEVASRAILAEAPPAKPQSLGDIISHLSPSSIIKAMAEGDVLQIVVFSFCLP